MKVAPPKPHKFKRETWFTIIHVPHLHGTMERPERPSRPEKGIRSSGGGHPYRERHRIVSSDSESDMEVDLSTQARVRTMRLQRLNRPSVEALTALTVQNSNSVGASASSTSTSDPYHMPSPIRLRDTQNGEAQSLYPFMVKDDGPHRSSTLFYRKRPVPPHFVSPLSHSLSDVLERRSNNRINCTRIQFPSPSTSSNWETKRFCPCPPADPLATGPEQKLPHRIISATPGSSSCLLEPHSAATASERPDRDDIRMRSHANSCSWPTAAGSNDAAGSSSLLQFFDDDENNTLRNIVNEGLDIGNSDLTDTNARSTHNAVGTLDLSCPPANIIVPPPPLHPAAVVAGSSNNIAMRDSGVSNGGGSNNSSNNNNSTITANGSNNNVNSNANGPIPCASIEPIINSGNQYDNSGSDHSNVVVLSEPSVNFEIRESLSSRLRRLRHSSHSSSLQNDSNNDLPTRASSHILRALDELRFTPMRDPWLHVEHNDHSVVPGIDFPYPRAAASGSLFNNNSSPISQNSTLTTRMVFVDSDRDDESEELIERATDPLAPDPVPVEDVSDLDEFDPVMENPRESRNRQAVLTHPANSNTSNSDGQRSGNNQTTDVNFVENENSDSLRPTPQNGDREGLQDGTQMDCENSANDQNASVSNNVGGTGDDVIILTMSPSPRRQPQQPAVNAENQQPAASHATCGASAAVDASQQSNNICTESKCSVDEVADNGNRVDCEEFNSKLVSLLECPVCMETIVPPIHQCRKGHPVCQICRPKLNVCPTCRARFSENRNLLMEKVAEMMLFPCKNVHMGCPTKVQLKDKRRHELSCGFRQYDCIINSCNWRGFKQELVVHVSLLHSNQVIVGNNQRVRVPLQSNVQTTWVLSAMDEVFIVTFIIKDRFLNGCTVYLGDFENAKDFLYEFTLSNKDNMQFQWRAKTFPDKSQTNCLILSNKGFYVPVNHSIIEDRDPRLLNEIEISVNVLKNESVPRPLASSTPSGSSTN